MTAYVIYPDGTRRDVSPKNGECWTLPELYDLLGCRLVETLECRFRGDMMAVFDEEGMLTGRDFNPDATDLVPLLTGDYLVGPVLFTPRRLFQ